MCTLTFIPKSLNDFILTSNRDEAPGRETIAPDTYIVDGIGLLFPKDAEAGGTWIGVSEKKRLICLLNGGFSTHISAVSYKMSRGIIVKKLLTASNFKDAINQFDLVGIEPFTIILIDWEKSATLYELVWDGLRVYFEEKPWAPMIWSSSLLYDREAKLLREQWFLDFLVNTLKPNLAEILNFHKTAGRTEGDNALIMNRGFVRTKSITQVSKVNEDIIMKHEDLQTNILTSRIV